MNKFMRFKTVFLMLIVALVTTSCSSTRLAYNFVDVYLQWKIEGYVSLTSEQKKQTKRGLDEFHQWHRTHELPLYAHYMDALKITLNKPDLRGDIIHKETDQLQVLLDNSIDHLMPTFVDLAFSLSEKQISELEKNLNKKREKYHDEYVAIGKEKLYKKRIDDLRQYMDPFFGSYSKQQKKALDSWAHDVIDYEERLIVQQKNWSTDLLNALKK